MKKAWDNHRKCRRCKTTRTKNTHCAVCTVELRKEKNVAKKKAKKPAKERRDSMRNSYIEAARRRYGKEGSIEIDDDAKVSEGEDAGAYVQAWVWVYSEEL